MFMEALLNVTNSIWRIRSAVERFESRPQNINNDHPMIPTIDRQISASFTKWEGKYLTFSLRPEYYSAAVHHYGLPVQRIREILRPLEITPVPRMPDFIRGVINLRGKIVSVIDLRKRLEIGRAEPSERPCLIVVEIGVPDNLSIQLGLLVDTVEDVVTILEVEIEPNPIFGGKYQSDYILGIAKLKGKVVTLLDLDSLLAGAELTEPAPSPL